MLLATSSGATAARLSWLTPAQCTRPSKSPWRASSVEQKASSASASARSQATHCALPAPCRSLSSSHSRLASSVERCATTSAACPAATSSRVTPAPIPRPPPVIKTRLPMHTPPSSRKRAGGSNRSAGAFGDRRDEIFHDEIIGQLRIALVHRTHPLPDGDADVEVLVNAIHRVEKIHAVDAQVGEQVGARRDIALIDLADGGQATHDKGIDSVQERSPSFNQPGSAIQRRTAAWKKPTPEGWPAAGGNVQEPPRAATYQHL